MTAAKFLQRLFESDREAPDFYDRNRMYHGDALVGAKPWWPPLSTVWQGQGVPPEGNRNEFWPDAWALLQSLHAAYLARKR
jgi:hypothetical protein